IGWSERNGLRRASRAAARYRVGSLFTARSHCESPEEPDCCQVVVKLAWISCKTGSAVRSGRILGRAGECAWSEHEGDGSNAQERQFTGRSKGAGSHSSRWLEKLEQSRG